MHPALNSYLTDSLNGTITGLERVSGGDIALSYQFQAGQQTYFIKTSDNPTAAAMFGAEAKGLQRIAAYQLLNVPQVFDYGKVEETAFLLMQYIPQKRPETKDFEKLGLQLAKLHHSGTDTHFGFADDNFIGALHQSNTPCPTWSAFYVSQRLEPQLQMAVSIGLLPPELRPKKELLLRRCESLMGDAITPALLHGDLWGGNFLIASDGRPYLIDPSVYFGHSEVDLAMSKLFGGFGPSFYDAYHELVPPHPNQTALTELYQLYYLLVHLNLFGRSYLNPVKQILKKYFG